MEPRKITNEELEDILEKHVKWINDEEGGVRANLEEANLYKANLYKANLKEANLKGANLEGANLKEVNLKWVNLKGTNLKGTNLKGANLKGANLKGANLKGANLEGANLDFSTFPLWCGGLDIHIDTRLATQLLYHLLRNVNYSNNIPEEFKVRLLTDDLVELANEFHRVDGCGIIEKRTTPYVKVPDNHIVIDFDIKGEDGTKSLTRNIEEASKWPATYAELSKSGKGVHLHYIYSGDPSKLSRVAEAVIEKAKDLGIPVEEETE